MSSDSSYQQWFALQVKTRWERSTKTLLSGKGYEVLLPTYTPHQSWSRRSKDIVAPLFPGYVFCRFDVSKRLPVLVTPGVMAVVGRGRVPVPVSEIEMSAIRTMVSSQIPAQPWPYLEVGQRVRIEDQALSGVEGILIRFKGAQRIVVSVSLLRRSVALEIDRLNVTPIRTAQDTAPGLSAQTLPHRVIA